MVVVRKFYDKVLKNSFFVCLLLALFSNIVVESLGRRSIIQTFVYMIDKPLVFLYNTMLMIVPYLLALLVRRRTFVYVVVTVLYVIIGSINFYLLSYRTTPFTGVDITLIDSLADILTKYFSGFQIVLVSVLLIILIVVLAFLWVILPKRKVKMHRLVSLLCIVLYVFSIGYVTNFALSKYVLSRKFGNLKISYQEYGFAYCFSVTVIDSGIDMPDGYSKTMINRILDPSNTANADSTDYKTPNIIIVQLESFFDPTDVIGLELSEDPLPNFHKYSDEFTSGYVTVPTVVAGTCNTEFEMITGMDRSFFGPGEYPYKTILRETAAESIPYDLLQIGYSTHAIHNNKAAFYGRNVVYANLGFQTFTPIEYMSDLEYTPNGWAKDNALIEPIIDALDSSEGPDYVYTVSVQGHGSYPSEASTDYQKIKVLGGLDSEEQVNEVQYYVNEINEMDEFIGNLIDTVNQKDEDTIIIFFGDHLPGVGLSDDDLINDNMYQTKYFIWDNMGLEEQDQDVYAYQLVALELAKFGINQGTLIKYHQNYLNSKNYSTNMERLEYDMLYGEGYIYNGNNPFTGLELKYGTKEVTISSVHKTDTGFLVEGENFTDWTKIYVNGEYYPTSTVSKGVVTVDYDEELVDGDVIVAGQSRGETIFSQTPDYIYNSANDGEIAEPSTTISN